MPRTSYKTTAGRRFRKRTGLKYKKTIKPTATNMYKIAKQVNKLIRAEKRNHQYLNFKQSSVFNLSSTVVPAQTINLSDFALISAGQIFGSANNDIDANQMVHKSIGMQCRISLENYIAHTLDEKETIRFSVFLVSLKDEIGDVFTPLTGALNLAEGITHSSGNSGLGGYTGHVLLNKKMFTIHKKKFFTLSNNTAGLATPTAQTQFGIDKQWYWKLKPNAFVKNPRGSWSTMSSANDPSKQYYILIFNDNSSLDAEYPSMWFNAVHTIMSEGQ